MELQLRIHAVEVSIVTVTLEGNNPVNSFYNFLCNEYKITEDNARIVLNNNPFCVTEENLQECSNKHLILDIVTIDAMVYVSVNCDDAIITLRVPNFITLFELKTTINQVLNYKDSQITTSRGLLSDLDLDETIFYYNMGFISPPDDFEEYREMYGCDDNDDICMYPCRYSFPNATTFDNYQLISTQHSLHLYYPVQLPDDYLTGKAATLTELPNSETWKKHVRIQSTPGLFGYNADIIENDDEDYLNIQDNADPSEIEPLIPLSSILKTRSSSYYRKNSISSQTKEREGSPPHCSRYSVYSRQSIKSDDLNETTKPESVMYPLLPSELIQYVPPCDIMRDGREPFIQHGIDDLIENTRLVQGMSSYSLLNSIPSSVQHMTSSDGDEPSESNRQLLQSDSASSKSRHFFQITTPNVSYRHMKSDLSPNMKTDSTSEVSPPYRGRITICSPHDLQLTPSYRNAHGSYRFNPISNIATSEARRSYYCSAEGCHDLQYYTQLSENKNILLLINEARDIKNEKDCRKLSDDYFRLRAQSDQEFVIDLSKTCFVAVLSQIAFKYISSSIFETCVTILIDLIKEVPYVSQTIISCINCDVIINNLKATKATSVDRRVLFLQFICELVRTERIAVLFYDNRGIDALIQINDSTGSSSVRHNTATILEVLVSYNMQIAYSAFHASFQIFQKEPVFVQNFLQLLLTRINQYPEEHEISKTLRNDILNIRLLYPEARHIQDLCNKYLSDVDEVCRCTVY